MTMRNDGRGRCEVCRPPGRNLFGAVGTRSDRQVHLDRIFGAWKNFTTQFSEGVTRPDYSSQIWSKHHETAVQIEGGLGQLESHKITRRTGYLARR